MKFFIHNVRFIKLILILYFTHNPLFIKSVIMRNLPFLNFISNYFFLINIIITTNYISRFFLLSNFPKIP